jgi:ELWxxDGT repeat protein
MIHTKNHFSLKNGLRCALAGLFSLAFLLAPSAPQKASATPKTEGASPNPHIVQDLNPEPFQAIGSQHIALGGYFYFDVPANTCQLWRSDGSQAGTELFLDLGYIQGSWYCVNPVVAGNFFYFENSDPDHGYELWVSDGTQSGTHLLKDIAPGPEGNGLLKTLVVGDELFFYTYNSTHGAALWKTDGSEAGTILLYNSMVPSDSVSDPQLNNVQGVVYFIGNDAAHGMELWKSDGTPQGTNLVKDIFAGSDGSYPFIQSIQGNTLYFSAYDGVHGTELWKSDGSASGTQLIKDINPGAGDSLSPGSAYNFTLFNGDLFFAANDGSHGTELWKTDGTSAETQMVMDFSAGSTPSFFPSLDILNGVLIILAGNQYTGEYGLWRSDGTTSGTSLIKDLAGENKAFGPVVLGLANGELLFAAADENGYRLYKTNGSQAGTSQVTQFSSENPYLSFSATFNGKLYFNLGLSSGNASLWRSDGTQAGTLPVLENERSMIPLGEWDGNLLYVRDITDGKGELWIIDGATQTPELLKGAGSGQSCVIGQYFLDGGSQFYFLSFDSTQGSGLWRSDGSPAGTQFVRSTAGTGNSYIKDLTPASSGVYFRGTSSTFPTSQVNLYKLDRDGLINVLLPESGNPTYASEVLSFAGNLFFVVNADNPAHAAGLWRSDGTTAGTNLFLAEPYTNGYISDLTLSNNQLFFIAHDDLDKDTALWRTDGSSSGTWRVLDLSKIGHLNFLSDVNGSLFGIGTLNNGNNFLMATDGTPAGTRYIHEFSGGIDPSQYLSWNGALYFQETNKLWVSDGTSAGTRILGQFEYQVISDHVVSSIRNLTGVAGQVFFSAKDGSQGVELWRTDGSAAGTLLVKDIYPGSSSYPQPVASIGSTLYFTADDGVHGRELWRSDGTEAGTDLVKDLRVGKESSYAGNFGVLNNVLYFSASDGQYGQELWRSDGTEAGTSLVKDILPGAGGSAPQVSVQAGLLYLGADDGVHGIEPWVSDGTESGTTLMGDVNPGQASSLPDKFTYWGGQVYFEASDFEHGRELWDYDLGLTPRGYMPLLTR